MFKNIINFFFDFKEYEKIICPVCLKNYNEIKFDKNSIYVNKCGHLICSLCNFKKLINNLISRCDLCRSDLSLQRIDSFTCSTCKKFNINSKNFLFKCGHIFCFNCMVNLKLNSNILSIVNLNNTDYLYFCYKCKTYKSVKRLYFC
jgi:hypothetical protein